MARDPDRGAPLSAIAARSAGGGRRGDRRRATVAQARTRPRSSPLPATCRRVPYSTAADLRTIALPPPTVPAGATTDLAAVVGSQLSGPLRRGEPLTDVRLTDGVLRRPAPDWSPHRSGSPIRRPRSCCSQASESTSWLPAPMHKADRPPSAVATATVVAADVMVVAIPNVSETSGTASIATGDVGVEGTLVVLATSLIQASQLAQAQVSSRLSAIVVG